MTLTFTKMHGLGNDFIVIDGINQSVSLSSEQISQLADRHFGVGFDQLLLVEPAQSKQAQFKYRIYNADGGEVAQCGNGARCFAQFVRNKGLTDETLIAVETNSGLLHLRIIDDSRVEVDMGIPNFEPNGIPLDLPQKQPIYSVDFSDRQIEFMALSIGNPHAVILVDDVNTADVEGIGHFLQSHKLFPERVNVGFLQIIHKHAFKLRVFERGSGETMACGSGACAALAAANQAGLLDSHATGHLRGGQLELSWQGDKMPVMMTGATATVFEGVIEL